MSKILESIGTGGLRGNKLGDKGTGRAAKKKAREKRLAAEAKEKTQRIRSLDVRRRQQAGLIEGRAEGIGGILG